MTIEEASGVLLKWIRSVTSISSFSQIDAVCEIILEQVVCPDELKTYKKNLLLYPLLRRGLVEYASHRRIAATPEHGFYHSCNSQVTIVFINPSEETQEKLKTYESCRTDVFGSLYLTVSHPGFRNIHRNYPMSLQKNNALSVLKKMPNFFDYLFSLERCYPTQTTFFYWHPSGKWKPVLLEKPGCYRATEEIYSKRFFYDGKTLFELPERINPDATHISKCAHLIINGASPYNEKNKTLKLNAFETPILLERLLRLNSFQFNYCLDNQNLFEEVLAVPPVVSVELKRIFKVKRGVS